MAWKDYLPWNVTEQKVSKTDGVRRAVSSVYTGGVLNPTGNDYASLATEGYINNAYVRRSIDLIANAARGIPLVAREADGTEASDSELQALLDTYSGGFSGEVFAYLMLAGNSYIEVVSTSSGKPVELYTLRPDMVKQDQDGSYRFQINNKKVKFDDGEIIHVRLFNPVSGVTGVSPILAARRAMDAHNSANDWNAQVLQNQAAPSGILTSEGYLSDEDFERLKKEMRSGWTGTKNAGLPKLLDNGLKWTPISYTSKDLEWLEGKRDAAMEIAAAFGVPPELIGIGQTTYSNRKEAAVSFYTDTVKPLMETYVTNLTEGLAKRFGDGMYVEADYSAIAALRESEEAKINRTEALEGIATINEQRAIWGLPEVEGGDVIVLSSNTSELGEDE